MPFTISRIDHRLDPTFFGSVENLLDKSAAKEYDTLMIACSDHGTAPDNVSFAPPGRMMILQHLAASIPSASECKNRLDIKGIIIVSWPTTLSSKLLCVDT